MHETGFKSNHYCLHWSGAKVTVENFRRMEGQGLHLHNTSLTGKAMLHAVSEWPNERVRSSVHNTVRYCFQVWAPSEEWYGRGVLISICTCHWNWGWRASGRWWTTRRSISASIPASRQLSRRPKEDWPRRRAEVRWAAPSQCSDRSWNRELWRNRLSRYGSSLIRWVSISNQAPMKRIRGHLRLALSRRLPCRCLCLQNRYASSPRTRGDHLTVATSIVVDLHKHLTWMRHI